MAAQNGAFDPHLLSFVPSALFPCCCQTFVNGQLRLEGRQEKGQGKCPFDPFQRYSSLMVGECLHQDSKANAGRKEKYLFQRGVQILICSRNMQYGDLILERARSICV